MNSALGALIVTLATGTAWAQQSFIDRPLILAPRTLQAEVGLDVIDLGEPGLGYEVTGAALDLAADVGIAQRFQAGLALTFPLDTAAFGSLIVDAQVGLNDHLSVRVDTGITRGTLVGETSSTDGGLFLFGLGLPTKLRLSSHVAFVSGRTSPAGFGHPQVLTYTAGSIHSGANPFYCGDDVLTLVVNGENSGGLVFGLPFGFMIAPNDWLAIVVHAGYRFILNADYHSAINGFPFGADVLVGLGPHLDASVSADWAGPLDRDGLVTHYLDYRQFLFLVRARF